MILAGDTTAEITEKPVVDIREAVLVELNTPQALRNKETLERIFECSDLCFESSERARVTFDGTEISALGG